MSIEEFVVSRKNTQGPKLFAVVGKAEQPRYAVALIHGYADHAARYLHVIEWFREHGITTVALDLRGHGRSEGGRGYCGNFEEYWDDLAELDPLLEAHAPNLPRILFGHSMGGLATASSLLGPRGMHVWRAAVWSAPFFQLALPVPAIKEKAAHLLAKIAPKFGMSSGLYGRDLTHDETIARGYDEDPLVFKKANTKFYVEAVKMQERLFREAKAIKLPFFLGFGTGDKVASPEGAKRFVAAAGSTVKEFKLYEGLYHEILNEPSWRDIAGDMKTFMDAHASS